MKKQIRCQEEFTVEMYDELDVIIDGRLEITDFRPGRPIPACSNPSSPRYYDDGDPMEYEVAKVILNVNGTEIEVDPITAERIIAAVNVRLENKLEDIAGEIMQDAMMDAMEEDFVNRSERMLFGRRAV